MGGLDDSIEDALAINATAASAAEAEKVRVADREAIKEGAWLRKASPILVEARDALLRRDLSQAHGMLESRPEGLEADVLGWPLISQTSDRQWFLTTDAALYDMRLDHDLRIRSYLNGHLGLAWFILTWAVVPKGFDLSTDAELLPWREPGGENAQRTLESELIERIVALISMLNGRTETPARKFFNSKGEPIELDPEIVADLPPAAP